MSAFQVTRVTEPSAEVIDLIERHFAAMRSQSPEESCHVLGADDLFASGAQVFTLQDAHGIWGMGAIKPLDARHGELKSMHTKAEARGRGIGSTLLEHLLTPSARSWSATGQSRDRIRGPFRPCQTALRTPRVYLLPPFR